MTIVHSGTLQSVSLDGIILDESIQPREETDASVIADYAELYSAYKGEDSPFPPPDLFEMGGQLYVADGFHRIEAARKAGLSKLECRIHHGSQRDAMLFAAEANARHGLPYNFGDKQRILRRLFADAEITQLSDRAIGRRFGMSHTYVSRVRKEETVGRAFDDELSGLVATVATATPKKSKGTLTPEHHALASIFGLLPEDIREVQRQGCYTTDRIRGTIVSMVVHDKESYDNAKHNVARHLERQARLLANVAARRNHSVPLTPASLAEDEAIESPPEASQTARAITTQMLATVFGQQPLPRECPSEEQRAECPSEEQRAECPSEEQRAFLRAGVSHLALPVRADGETTSTTSERYADALVSALAASGIPLESVTLDELNEAMLEWQRQALDVVQEVIAAWSTLRREIDALAPARIVSALPTKLQDFRFRADSDTARQIGALLKTLEAYAKDHPDAFMHPARRVVEM